MKKTASEKRTDKLWNEYDNDNEADFWKKYEKLLVKAKSKKEAVTVSTMSVPTIRDKKIKNEFYSRYYLHGVRNKLFVAAEVTGFSLFWFYAPPEWTMWVSVFLFSENLGKFAAQRNLVNFKIVEQGIIIHNKIARRKEGHRWDEIASVELIRERKKYYLKVTGYDFKEYKYLYTLSPQTHEEFFARLAEHVEVFQLIDYL